MSSVITTLKTDTGFPLPQGVTHLREGINFAVFSRHATAVSLVIDYFSEKNSTPVRKEYVLEPEKNRTGDLWHILILGDLPEFNYGFRMDGPCDKKNSGTFYDNNLILIDPCSRILLPRQWGEPSRYGQIPCCRGVNHEFDWLDDKPPGTPLSETIIYELHVRGFTRNRNSGVSSPGSFKGIVEKIPYLKDLGITAVELMPITEFDENDIFFVNPDTGEKLKNFWGYSPVSFFALNSSFSSEPAGALTEFKEMVRALHKAGIEVYLDMVFNHTGEGGYNGTTSSFRGIDNPIFYLLDEEHEYLNFSGCGNTMNCNHPVVRDLIRESLRYWVTEMHVDGFRFDLASILGRDREGHVLVNPPIIEAIAEDPVLRDTKIIAEAWDAAGLYQVGSFSTDSRWAEWNGRFRDDIRYFMTGAPDSITRLATRIAGSSDLYQQDGRGPLCSINFITSHDGFTLYDLVSYNEKHNHANGENNRDGENHNISWNSGCEGETDNQDIIELRFRRMKSFIVLLFLSQGVPMMTGGDEFARTQKGNNNSWCQDNATSWLDWSLLETHRDFYRFVKKCIQLRKSSTLFRQEQFFSPEDQSIHEQEQARISWQYLLPGQQNWSHDCHGLAFMLSGQEPDGRPTAFFIMLNGHRTNNLRFTLPVIPFGKDSWHLLIDSSAPPPYDFPDDSQAITSDTFKVPSFGTVVLKAD
ncbi:glycogen operon protein GlgX homolog [Desulfomarina profundi]|uniref:Glycogen operon protein GlgX homolog n=1 Tax=Desulfomarina profundi TaxID=2772557 RepID=A0A8D5FE20_9BACT|nr:glycogen debranching protein GlgX [Desulfomarina profundi]BCL59578.1 glycogen operon protein GlgX homolog [Desulfomarina profundi]